MAAFNPSMLGSLGNQPQVLSLLQLLGWQDPNAGGGGGGGGAGGGAPGGSGGGGPPSPGGAPVGGGGGQSADPGSASERDMYGSFDLNVNAEPKISDAADAAAQGGTSLAGLMGGFFPKSGDGVTSYKIPSDRGGFFTAEDLFRHSDRGSVPQIGSFMANRPSTNNWRLLGMGPGWILRNGQLIDTNSTGARWGGSASWMPSGGASGEQSMPALGIGLGTGGSYGVPNLFASGVGPKSWGWPGADTWYGEGNMSMTT